MEKKSSLPAEGRREVEGAATSDRAAERLALGARDAERVAQGLCLFHRLPGH